MKNKNTKLIVLLALIVSVVGLTLGFAAFSNQLKISSSATVTPDASDFEMVVYGIGNEITGIETVVNLNSYNSKMIGLPANFVDGSIVDTFYSTTATIDNTNLEISNISSIFTEPSQRSAYYFMIKNEGEYDAYLDLSVFEKFVDGNSINPSSCVAGEGTTESLVTEACKSIGIEAVVMDSNFEDIYNSSSDFTENYLIKKKDYIFLVVSIFYEVNAVRADGPFTATFDDISLDFSTVSN